jgi:glutaredoxin 3
MAYIEVYTTATCPYCKRARRLLDRKGVVYHEIRVDRERHQLAVMMERSQRDTVPQIFIDNHHIGGYDDMAALDACGDLDPLLRQ